MRASAGKARLARTRAIAAALAILALVLQSLAPAAIAPPRGQPVHFAHVHHAEHADHSGGHAQAGDASQPEDDACPVCKSLAAAGAGIAAPAAGLAIAEVPVAPRVASYVVQAPRAVVARAHQARAPPSLSA
ncbi:MAG: DUF2946 family protein, partial [Alphaproteobacteria bacterium]